MAQGGCDVGGVCMGHECMAMKRALARGCTTARLWHWEQTGSERPIGQIALPEHRVLFKPNKILLFI